MKVELVKIRTILELRGGRSLRFPVITRHNLSSSSVFTSTPTSDPVPSDPSIPGARAKKNHQPKCTHFLPLNSIITLSCLQVFGGLEITVHILKKRHLPLNPRNSVYKHTTIHLIRGKIIKSAALKTL